MGTIYQNDGNWYEIHSAYGITLKAKYAKYEWYYGDTSKIITDISVNGREVNLGYSHFILANHEEGKINMEDDKDLLCYYFATCKEKDDWEFEQFFIKEYHGALWRHQTRNRMLNARLEEETKRKQAEREQQRNAKISEIAEYANRKKLRMIMEYDTAYLIKINKRKHKDSDKATDEMVLSFAREYPGNGIEIVETREVV